MTNKQKGCLTTVIVLILVSVLVVGMLAAFTSGFTNWDASTWFGSGQTDDESVGDEEINDTSGAVINAPEGNGVLMSVARIAKADYAAYGVSPLAETAYTVTATVVPSTADDKSLDWAVAWSNGASEWASGKNVTDYLTVTPVSDGAASAALVCMQPFGEQIIVTCTSRQNPDASAACTVDYYKRIETLDASMSDGVNTVKLSSGGSIPFSSDMMFSLSAAYTDGTAEEEYTHTAKVKFTSAFAEHVEDHTDDYIGGMKIGDFFGRGYSGEYTLNYGDVSNTFFEALCYSDNGGSYTIDDDPYLVDVFYRALKSYSGNAFTFTLTSEGNSTGTVKSVSYDVGVDVSDITTGVASVTLEPGSIFI